MELRHFRYFVAVAETLNFRRAAEKLRVAQPALSAQIKALENELDTRLFERTTRSVRLTQAGLVFLEEAHTVLAAALLAEQRVRSVNQGVVGTLRLGVIAPAANSWLARVLQRFRAACPGVQLAVFDLLTPEQLQRLRAGELEAGLLRLPIGLPELEWEVVEEAAYVLALPAGHRLAHKPKLGWKDFHDEAMVMAHPNLQHGYYDPFLAACARAGAKPRPAQYAHDIQTKLWLISAGFGVAPTTSTVMEIKRPGLVFRKLPPGLPPVQTVLAWRRDNHSPVLTHFRQACQPRPSATLSPSEN